MRRPILCAGRPVSLIILAGGRSRRMKRSKALLPVSGMTLLEHVLLQVEGYFDEIMVSLSPGQRTTMGRYAPWPAAGRRSSGDPKGRSRLRPVMDAVPGQGPMAGILTGLKTSRNDVCAVIACDIPHIHIGFLRRLVRRAADRAAVVPVSAEGLAEPLFAVYHKKAAPQMEKLIASGTRSLLPLLDRVDSHRLPLKETSWLKNLNTPEDYRAFLKTIAPGHAHRRT